MLVRLSRRTILESKGNSHWGIFWEFFVTPTTTPSPFSSKLLTSFTDFSHHGCHFRYMTMCLTEILVWTGVSQIGGDNRAVPCWRQILWDKWGTGLYPRQHHPPHSHNTTTVSGTHSHPVIFHMFLTLTQSHGSMSSALIMCVIRGFFSVIWLIYRLIWFACCRHYPWTVAVPCAS